MRRSIAIAALVILLSTWAASAATVTNSVELLACLSGTDSSCQIVSSEVIYLPRSTAVTRNLAITGGGLAIIDLMGNSSLVSTSSSASLTISDLTIQNGVGSIVTAGGPIYVANVTFLNMLVTSLSGGVIYQPLSTALSLGRILGSRFVNCTAPNGGISAVNIFNPTPGGGWTLADTSFIDCSGTNVISHTPLSITSALNMASALTVAGIVTFTSNAGFATYSSAVKLTTTSGTGTLSISSDISSPSTWYFSTTRCFTVTTTTAAITFEAGSLFVVPWRDQSDVLFFSVGSKAFNVTILSDLQMEYSQLLIGGGDGAPVNIYVAGQLTANAPQNYWIVGQTTITIMANSIRVLDAFSVVIYGANNGKVTLASSTDLVVTKDPLALTYTPLLQIGSSVTLMVPSGLLQFSGMRLAQAVSVTISGQLAMVAKTILFDDHHVTTSAVYGAAITLQKNGNLTMVATDSILFSNNKASNGSAIYTETPSTLFISTPNMTFANNAASVGSTLFIHSSHASVFSTANFVNNLEGNSCLVDFTDRVCVPFDNTGSSQGNTMLIQPGNSTCPINDERCMLRTYPAEPESPPTYPPPVGAPTASSPVSTAPACSGPPPSVGTWTCVNGQWVSTGSVTAPSVTIPGSPVVIQGNLTITGTVTLSGLTSSVTVEGGCVYIDGSLQVELTPEELEEIAKQTGTSRTTTLITQSANCTTNLASLAVNPVKTSNSCRKVSSSTESENDGTKTSLVAVFKVDSSSCNTKWIILGCVLGAFLIVAVTITLLFMFHPRVKDAWSRAK